MAEYIERKSVYEDFEKCNGENPKWTPSRVKTLIARQKAADVATVVHGRWIMVDDSCGKYACSACREIEQECTEWGAGHYNPVDKDYCPNCGAKMDLEG